MNSFFFVELSNNFLYDHDVFPWQLVYFQNNLDLRWWSFLVFILKYFKKGSWNTDSLYIFEIRKISDNLQGVPLKKCIFRTSWLPGTFCISKNDIFRWFIRIPTNFIFNVLISYLEMGINIYTISCTCYDSSFCD